MAHNSLSQHEWKIYHYNEIINDLNEYITKMCALVEVVLVGDFTQYKPETMHDYWWSLNDLLSATKTLCEELETTDIR
jgi:hypothetical protein